MTTRSRSLAGEGRCQALQCLHGSADRDYDKRLLNSTADIFNSKNEAWAFLSDKSNATLSEVLAAI